MYSQGLIMVSEQEILISVNRPSQIPKVENLSDTKLNNFDKEKMSNWWNHLLDTMWAMFKGHMDQGTNQKNEDQTIKLISY